MGGIQLVFILFHHSESYRSFEFHLPWHRICHVVRVLFLRYLTVCQSLYVLSGILHLLCDTYAIMRLFTGDTLEIFRDYSSLSINPHGAILYSFILLYVYSLVGNGGGGNRTLHTSNPPDCCDYAVFLSSLAGISMPLISISVAMCSFHSAMVVFGLQI